MHLKPFSLLFLPLSCCLALCKTRSGSTTEPNTILQTASAKAQLHTIANIKLPPGFTRQPTGNADFASWLLNVKLKKDRTVYLYNGHIKPNQQAQYVVLDIPVPNENLQQCADAVMRLRSEFLFKEMKYDQIIFIDNDRTAYPFTAPYNRQHLEKYLRQVFGMCGTASLSKQLKPKYIQDIYPGDVFIRGGLSRSCCYCNGCCYKPARKKDLSPGAELYAGAGYTYFEKSGKCRRQSLV